MNPLKKLRDWFIQGLVAVVPLTLTIYAVYWIGYGAELYLGHFIKLVIPGDYYVPGLGIILTFGFIIMIGALINAWIIRKALDLISHLMERVPFIKTVYGSLRDLIGLFSKQGGEKFSRVVMVDPFGTGNKILGFVTRESFEDCPDGVGGEGDVAVFVQMGYQIGGFTIVVDEQDVEPVDMSLEEGLRFALTAGVRTRQRSLPGITPPEESTDREGT